MSEKPQPTAAIKVFYSYAHEDEELRKRLDQHFSFLKREQKIEGWYDGELKAGERWRDKIDEYLNSADVILLLVSAAFADSDFCYSVEMKRAMERHEAGEAVVVPILLHPCDWQNAPFAELQALPGGTPISEWPNTEKALYEVARGIREVVEDLIARYAVAPPAATEEWQDSSSANVPPPPAIDFVPRKDREGRDIVERLKSELTQKRLTVLWGEGGVGKTTIAAEVARALTGVFGERIVWAGAEKRADFTYVALLNDIATQLGDADLTKLAAEPKEQAVRRLIAAARTLIILDNFETVSPEEKVKCADFLAARAQCSALITTRERVAHDAARHIHVESMDDAEAREFVERWVKQEAQSPSAFEGLDYNEIIRAADARPYVLQWVLARIDLALEPRDVLEELSRAEGEVGERIFRRSFELPQLGDDGRDTLLALSLFTPSASRPALGAAAGFGDDHARLNEAVKRLAALRLVETARGGQRLAVRGLTRSLARSRLSGDEQAVEFRRRFILYFTLYAYEHRGLTAENLDALEEEKDNLLAAMEVASAEREQENLIAMRGLLNDFLSSRGYWDEAINSGGLALAAARETGDTKNLAYIMGNVAVVLVGRGGYEEAKESLREVLKALKEAGDEQGAAVAMLRLGNVAQAQGEIEEAQQLYDTSLEIMRRLDDKISVASILHEVGLIKQNQGELEAARQLYDESLDISRGLGQQEVIAGTISQIGILLLLQGKLDESKAKHEESLAIRRKLGEQEGIAIDLHQLGRLALLSGDRDEAARLFQQSLIILKKLGSRFVGVVQQNLSEAEGEPD